MCVYKYVTKDVVTILSLESNRNVANGFHRYRTTSELLITRIQVSSLFLSLPLSRRVDKTLIPVQQVFRKSASLSEVVYAYVNRLLYILCNVAVDELSDINGARR